MSQTESMYNELLLRHHRNPCGYGLPDNPTQVAEGTNSRCGDEVVVGIRMEEGRIAQAGFEAQACAVSRSSASLMIQEILGLSSSEAERVAAELHESLHSSASEDPDGISGELRVLTQFRHYPDRKDCVLLPWRALTQALKKGNP